MKTVSIGRIITSHLGIYKIVSGAFGAFRRDILKQIGGWDIGPGLDGDITIKIRKSGYKIFFQPKAICLTSVPETFERLRKQRLRWDKSIIRFRIRKHRDVYYPNANFKWSNFFALFENVFYNLILDITWLIYMIDVLLNYSSQILYIIPMNFTLYVFMAFIQFGAVLLFTERKAEEIKLWKYLPLMTLYTGYYLRYVRTLAYFQELFLKKSYEDVWNPTKSSKMAKRFSL